MHGNILVQLALLLKLSSRTNAVHLLLLISTSSRPINAFPHCNEHRQCVDPGMPMEQHSRIYTLSLFITHYSSDLDPELMCILPSEMDENKRLVVN